MIKLDYFQIVPTEKPIFIIASGHRCGSTLLQRFLNSCTDILIWGEHNGYLNKFVGEFENLLEWESRFSSNRKTYLLKGYDNFVPNMTPEDHEMLEAAAIYFVSLFGLPAARLGHSIWGFKEVRYDINIALFLQRCFPKARFIHLTRNVVDCFISMKHWEQSKDPWHRKWTENSIDNWQKINYSFLKSCHRLRRVFQIRFEDMVSDPSTFLKSISKFLEMPEGSFDQNVFERLIHGQGETGLEERTKILPLDLTNEEMALLLRDDIVKIANEYNYKIDF